MSFIEHSPFEVDYCQYRATEKMMQKNICVIYSDKKPGKIKY